MGCGAGTRARPAASGVLPSASGALALGIVIIGTVLFGTRAVRPGPDAVAVVFSHSAQLALCWPTWGSWALALILVLALPRRIPGR